MIVAVFLRHDGTEVSLVSAVFHRRVDAQGRTWLHVGNDLGFWTIQERYTNATSSIGG